VVVRKEDIILEMHILKQVSTIIFLMLMMNQVFQRLFHTMMEEIPFNLHKNIVTDKAYQKATFNKLENSSLLTQAEFQDKLLNSK
jgi:hypothetical protein